MKIPVGWLRESPGLLSTNWIRPSPLARIRISASRGATWSVTTAALIASIYRSTAEPAPPRSGTRIRVLDIPPETAESANIDPAQARALFAEIGAEGASTNAGEARHPHMHRTETVDYGIVLEGEITLLVDIGEVTVRAGDIVVQRGTNHGWANRSGKNCRIAFILIDGKYVDGLA